MKTSTKILFILFSKITTAFSFYFSPSGYFLPSVVITTEIWETTPSVDSFFKSAEQFSFVFFFFLL